MRCSLDLSFLCWSVLISIGVVLGIVWDTSSVGQYALYDLFSIADTTTADDQYRSLKTLEFIDVYEDDEYIDKDIAL